MIPGISHLGAQEVERRLQQQRLQSRAMTGDLHRQEIPIGEVRLRADLIGEVQAAVQVQVMTVGKKVTNTALITFRKGL
jgi:hypothetical protein